MGAVPSDEFGLSDWPFGPTGPVSCAARRPDRPRGGHAAEKHETRLLGSKCDAVGTTSREQTASPRCAQATEIFTRREKLGVVTRWDRMPGVSATRGRALDGNSRDDSEDRSECAGSRERTESVTERSEERRVGKGW